jgi:hypothetical protein
MGVSGQHHAPAALYPRGKYNMQKIFYSQKRKNTNITVTNSPFLPSKQHNKLVVDVSYGPNKLAPVCSDVETNFAFYLFIYFLLGQDPGAP